MVGWTDATSGIAMNSLHASRAAQLESRCHRELRLEATKRERDNSVSLVPGETERHIWLQEVFGAFGTLARWKLLLCLVMKHSAAIWNSRAIAKFFIVVKSTTDIPNMTDYLFGCHSSNIECDLTFLIWLKPLVYSLRLSRTLKKNLLLHLLLMRSAFGARDVGTSAKALMAAKKRPHLQESPCFLFFFLLTRAWPFPLAGLGHCI